MTSNDFCSLFLLSNDMCPPLLTYEMFMCDYLFVLKTNLNILRSFYIYVLYIYNLSLCLGYLF